MFTLHPQLAADTHMLGSLPLCRVLLMNNALYPWLILVPTLPDLHEITDLAQEQRRQLMEEIHQVAAVLKACYNPHKLNIASLGNIVPQLHVHIIARFTNDAAWPRPVWGVGEAHPYNGEALLEITQKFQKVLF